MLYVLDTSALIDAWRKWYSPQIVPGMWDKVEQLAKDSGLTIPDGVLLELSIQLDELYDWCKVRESFICTASTQPIQNLLKEISNKYPNLRKAGIPSKNFADPIAVAVAKHYSCAVVTHEKPSGDMNGPKMPDVCKAEKIRTIEFYELAREQNWKFT